MGHISEAVQDWPEAPLFEDISDCVLFCHGRGVDGPQIEDSERWSHHGLEAVLDPSANQVRPISLGIPGADRLVSPDTGQFIVIGAHPKCGKTSLAIQAANATAELAGHRQGSVCIVSLEMTASEIGAVRIAQKLGVATKGDGRHPDRPCLQSLEGKMRQRAETLIECWRDTKDIRVIDMD